ncbi:unnamed protein product, partial [Cyprideis torosa]
MEEAMDPKGKTPEESSIFTFLPAAKTFSLKKGVQFYLYINTSPCGDARVFSPQEARPMGVPSNQGYFEVDTAAGRGRGQLRTKIESGEGTIPIDNEHSTLTLDGVMSGQRLLAMSCSDKLCRWNILGFQGALLSHLVDAPIYFSGIVLGSFFHPSHMI